MTMLRDSYASFDVFIPEFIIMIIFFSLFLKLLNTDT